MTMVVAYFGTHADGIVSGLIEGPGEDSGSDLIDLYEADITVATFEDREGALEWLSAQADEVEDD